MAEQPGTSAQGLPASDGMGSALKRVCTSLCLSQGRLLFGAPSAKAPRAARRGRRGR